MQATSIEHSGVQSMNKIRTSSLGAQSAEGSQAASSRHRPNWFVALPVPRDSRADTVLTQLPAGLRRFSPEDLHITLAFLGTVDEATAWAAWHAAPYPPAEGFAVAARSWRALGPPQRPSAYGLIVDEANDTLAAWIAQHRDAIRAAAGLEAERRPALPHVTLGRPPRRGGQAIRERIEHWLAAAAVPDWQFRLDRLALYTWSNDRRSRLFARVAECTASL